MKSLYYEPCVLVDFAVETVDIITSAEYAVKTYRV